VSAAADAAASATADAAVRRAAPGHVGARRAPATRVALSATLLLAAAVAQPLAGQTVLTLEDALERARLHNPTYRQAQNNLELNVYETRQAWLNLLPNLSLTTLQTGTSWRRVTVAEDFFGRPLENPETRLVRTSTSNQGGRISLALDLRQFLQLQQRQTQADARQIAALSQWNAVRTSVVHAFLDAQQHELALELEERLLATARLTEEAAGQLFVLARSSRLDVLGAEVEVVAQTSAVERARAALRTSLLALRHLIGDPALDDVAIDPAPVTVFDPALLDEEALVRHAVGSSPQVLSQEATLETQRRSRSLQRAEWLPTLFVQAASGRQRFEQGGGAFLDVNPGGSWDRHVALSLSFPDPGQFLNRQNAAGQTDVAIRNQEETLRQLRGQVEQDVRRLLVELRSSHADIALQERRAAVADERVRLLQAEYAMGRAGFLELQTAVNAAAAARRQSLQARFGFERARVDLERALGQPLDLPHDLPHELPLDLPHDAADRSR
jgi:outer membrane protein TolC